jgi:mannose-6-phosphate isomerase-like protein (cupin superfamily)
VPGWTICKLEEAQNVFEGNYPGEMRFLSDPLGTEQVAITYRRMPRHTGGKGSHGHHHKTQEELYYVISGKLQFKLDDEVVELEGGSCVRVPPVVNRSVWNDERHDAELLIISTRIEAEDDAVLVEDFWPA